LLTPKSDQLITIKVFRYAFLMLQNKVPITKPNGYFSLLMLLEWIGIGRDSELNGNLFIPRFCSIGICSNPRFYL